MQIKVLQVKKNYAKPWSTGADQGLTTKALEQMMNSSDHVTISANNIVEHEQYRSDPLKVKAKMFATAESAEQLRAYVDTLQRYLMFLYMQDVVGYFFVQDAIKLLADITHAMEGTHVKFESSKMNKVLLSTMESIKINLKALDK